ncbi:hypothetical protein G5V58_20010 [Nocardioides anomalus]|uniref:Galactose oxidase n=1 Tax=Nocardioides anomalus TaxID=2712223 RepID=A0A6G6WHE5_9ACTN|nr:hypothetical protein [Nocardioides anomalus]QIG44761.1 hypothetical protein G5V58_20010 [Nocardioides anomalus]
MRLLAALLLALALAGCADADGTVDRPSAGTWSRAADPPLSARYGPLLAWTGSEVLALGGHTGSGCPPSASCVDQHDGTRDGAAYDPDRDAWRPLADAPLEVDRFTGHVVVDGVPVVGDDRQWWSYDATADAWTALPAGAGGAPETALDGVVYSHVRAQVQALDLATRTWSDLPSDDLAPRLRDSGLFATPVGVVLIGADDRDTAPDEPTLTRADLWDGTTWRRLPETGQTGPFVHWTGQHLVNPDFGSDDGGEVDAWDRPYPHGGRLDPSTGAWSPLAGDPPAYGDAGADAWPLDAASGPLVAVGGFVYDDDAGTWTLLGRPGSPIRQDLASVWAGDRLVTVGGTDRAFRPVGQAWALSQPDR